MFNPYFLGTFLYIAFALLGALDASLIHLNILEGFAGLRWLRVHLITLGALTEFAFGALPLLLAARAGLPRPKIRWDIWLALNLGLLILLLGIPPINTVFITTGGTLIFVAALLLIGQLRQLRAPQDDALHGQSRKFYLAGLAYLLFGIFVGTGLWQGWSSWLNIQVPIEVHIHANNWGFMALVFAGLLVDLFPSLAGKPLATPKHINRLFWMMTIGAFGLVLGPWFKSNLFSVPGLVLHLSATIWLLVLVVQGLRGSGLRRSVGVLHLVTAYVWILAPVLVAPLIILGVPGFPGAGIEQNAPQALIYGWVLQFGFAVIPLLFRRLFLPHEPARLGGHWLSLIAVHLGGVALWAGIFLTESQGLLHGLAYALWALALLPMVWELWQILRASFAAADSLPAAGD